MNALAMRVGMGFLGDSTYDDGTFDPFYVAGGQASQLPTYSTQPTFPTSNNDYSPFKAALPTLLLGAEKLASNIFAPPSVSIAQAGSQQPQRFSGTLPPGYGYNAAGQIVPFTSGAQTAGISNAGINILGANIPWVVVLIIGGVLFFPGFTRRK